MVAVGLESPNLIDVFSIDTPGPEPVILYRFDV